MPVAVAHKVSATAHLVLREAAKEASLRGTTLAVIEVIESLDLDIAEAHKRGLLDEVGKVLVSAGLDVEIEVHTVTGEDTVADTVLAQAAAVGADLLVIGARNRSPVGKLLLGSATQSIILDATIPVLVVKSNG